MDIVCVIAVFIIGGLVGFSTAALMVVASEERNERHRQ